MHEINLNATSSTFITLILFPRRSLLLNLLWFLWGKRKGEETDSVCLLSCTCTCEGFLSCLISCGGCLASRVGQFSHGSENAHM